MISDWPGIENDFQLLVTTDASFIDDSGSKLMRDANDFEGCK
jgi:hypothetical protein